MTRHSDLVSDLVRRRLASQRLSGAGAESPLDLVRWMGAVQAQDFAGGLWGVGLRSRGAVEAEVEAAVAARSIVRTWPMRGTLHFVPAGDVRWMLRLLTPRVLAGSSGRNRQLGLDERDFAKAQRILTRALGGGRALTRPAAYAELERGGVSPAGQRGIHVLGNLAQRGVLCFGARQGKQPTFVLLEEWLPAAARDLSGDEALATLAGRYFRGHGPATLADFAWWTGLRVAEARRAIEAAGRALRGDSWGSVTTYSSADSAAQGRPPRSRGPSAALLPSWDEYLVAYRDRSAAVGHLADHDERRLELVGSPILLVDGRARGTWRRELSTQAVRVRASPWTPLSGSEQRAVDRAAARYAAFLGRELDLRT